MANTIDIPKLNNYIVVGPPASNELVSKINKYATIGTIANTLTIQKINKYIAVGPVLIRPSYTFDYRILIAISISYTFDYKIVDNFGTFTFDYRVTPSINKEFTFDYKVALSKSFTFNYRLPSNITEYFDWNAIDGGTGLIVDGPLLNSGATIGGWVPSTPGAITSPDHPIAPDLEVPLVLSYYGDFYLRIWLDPSLRRLTNPRLNTPIAFHIWSAYPIDNYLYSVIPTDLTGVDVTFSTPLLFGPYEYKTLFFTIGDDAPVRIDGTFDFIFDQGEATLRIIAVIIDIMRFVPNEPVNEIWQWKTILQQSWSSKEQRTAYRDEPRTRLEVQNMILDNEQRNERYKQLYAFIARDLRFPFFQYMTEITAQAEINDTKLFFDPALTNLRDDEYAVLFEHNTQSFAIVKVLSVDSDGATLEAGLDQTIPQGWFIIPTLAMRFPDSSGLSMEAVNGSLSLRVESTQYRALLRPDQVVALTAYDSLPIIDHKPIAAQAIDENFEGGADVLDNESSLPLIYTAWGTPLITSLHQWKFDREDDMDYWRKIGSTFRGMQVPFLMPTWRDDLPLFVTPSLGSNQIRTSNLDYASLQAFETYKRIQIETANGIIYRNVVSTSDDGAGGLIVTLSAPLGSSTGDNVISRIGYLNLVRMNSDEITIQHYVNFSVISLAVRTVNA